MENKPKTPKKKLGFAAHPENINTKGRKRGVLNKDHKLAAQLKMDKASESAVDFLVKVMNNDVDSMEGGCQEGFVEMKHRISAARLIISSKIAEEEPSVEDAEKAVKDGVETDVQDYGPKVSRIPIAK